jgi:O-antigen/teichoic acid export membrane protein
MTTYGLAVLALLTAGLSAIGRDLIAAVTREQAASYAAAAEVITWTAVGVFFQGAYLLTSIGLNITKHTQYYPASTLAAAAANIGLNFALVPTFGILGAAWANAAAYALQAVLAFRFSQRFYPIDYERRRIALLAAAALVSCVAARSLPAMQPVAGVLVRGATVVLLYAGGLAVAGFLHPEELRVIARLAKRRGSSVESPPPEVTERGGEIVAAQLPPEEQLDVAAPAPVESK